MKKVSISRFWGAVFLMALGCLLVRCQKIQRHNGPGDLNKNQWTTVDKSAAELNSSGPFVHPGILNTTAALDFIRSEADDPSRERYNSYRATLVTYTDTATMPTNFPSVVTVKSSGTTPTETQIKKNAEFAYALALRFAKTSDTNYAHDAKLILNGWAYNFDHYELAPGTIAAQPDLEASWVAPTFAAAAEIIRYYQPAGHSAHWSWADVNQFKIFLNTLKNNYINHTLSSGHQQNWTISAGYAKVALGVFLDSRSVYDAGMKILMDSIGAVIYADGTMPELCSRTDCIHFQYSLSGLTYAAEIAREQGQDSIFSNNRLPSGYGFMWKAFHNQFSCTHCSTAKAYPFVEVADRYYATDTTNYLRGRQPPYGIPSDQTFLGFTTYTHRGVPL